MNMQTNILIKQVHRMRILMTYMEFVLGCDALRCFAKGRIGKNRKKELGLPTLYIAEKRGRGYL